MKPLKEKQITRFWSKVEQPKDGCWTWRGCKSSQGYGYVRINGKTNKAHRIAYEIAYGRPPDNLLVCHHCDNPSCVRPDHLWLGTNKDNTLDRHNKGRTVMCRNPGGYKLKRSRKGELAARVKLKNRQVDEIRAKYEARAATIKMLATEYNVSPHTVWHIVTYRTRTSHLEQP